MLGIRNYTIFVPKNIKIYGKSQVQSGKRCVF